MLQMGWLRYNVTKIHKLKTQFLNKRKRRENKHETIIEADFKDNMIRKGKIGAIISLYPCYMNKVIPTRINSVHYYLNLKIKNLALESTIID